MRALIIFLASYLYLAVAIGWLIVLQALPRERRWRFVIVSAVAGVIAGLLAVLASHLHYEVRPFVTEHVQPLVAHGKDNGFPSDHAWLTMTATAITWFYNRRAALYMLLGTVLVGIGRVAALLHSPQQIAAGWLIGLIAAAAAEWFIRLIIRYRQREL